MTGRRIVFDLDGTLCTDEGGRYALARPLVERISRVRQEYESGAYVIIDTARGSGTRKDWHDYTDLQLKRWDVPYHELRTCSKPHRDVYVGDEAVSADDYFAGGHADRWPDEYFAERKGNEPKRQAAFSGELRFLRPHIGDEAVKPGVSRICDVGCSTGEFLDYIHWIGERYGMEINDHARKAAESRGIRFDRNITTERNFFDIVVFRGTLQHLPDPFRYLQLAHRALKPGGHLCILATPNTDSWCYRLLGNFPPPLNDAPRNYWMPSSRQLQNTLRNYGYEIVAVEYPYWGGPYARPVHDALSFARRLIGGRWVSFSWPGNIVNVIARKS